MTTANPCKPAAEHRTGEPRSDGWTPERQRIFLHCLSQHGKVALSCKVAEKSEAAAYMLRNSARGHVFALGWKAAVVLARDVIEDRLLAAAIDGVESVTRRYADATTVRCALNTKLSMAMLHRLDARAATLDDAEAAILRSICSAFGEFISDVIMEGGGADKLAAFLAAYPDPLAAQVAAAAKTSPQPQLVEETAVLAKPPGQPRPALPPIIAAEPCSCPDDVPRRELEKV